jgi:hypothetical protein
MKKHLNYEDPEILSEVDKLKAKSRSIADKLKNMMVSKTAESFERIIDNEIRSNVSGLSLSDDQHLRLNNIYLLKPISQIILEVINGSRQVGFRYINPSGQPFQIVYGGTTLGQSDQIQNLKALESIIKSLFADIRLSQFKIRYENEQSNLNKANLDLNSLRERIQSVCNRMNEGKLRYEPRKRLMKNPKLQNYPICERCPKYY